MTADYDWTAGITPVEAGTIFQLDEAQPQPLLVERHASGGPTPFNDAAGKSATFRLPDADLDIILPNGEEYAEEAEDNPGFIVLPRKPDGTLTTALKLHAIKPDSGSASLGGEYRLTTGSPSVALWKDATPQNPITPETILDASQVHTIYAEYIPTDPPQGATISVQWKESSGTSHPDMDRVVLLPVDITVRKKTEADAPPTGLLVKKGTEITFDINGTAPASAFPLPANTVKWKITQLKHDGTLAGWQDIPGEGPELDYTANTSGIFQAKAILTVAGGQPQELLLIREKDAPHADDSEGTVEDFHKKGAEDYFGVADTDWQIAVRDAALSNLGSTYYKNQGECVVQGSTVAPNPSNKCNIFIYHKCGDGGAPVPLTRGGLPGFRTGPPLAIDFWNDNTGRKDNANRTIESWEIPNWIRLPDATMPQPGWVPARPNLNGQPDQYGTHVGIFDYDGSWISAGFSKVNKHYHPKSPGYQPQGYRRYSGGN